MVNRVLPKEPLGGQCYSHTAEGQIAQAAPPPASVPPLLPLPHSMLGSEAAPHTCPEWGSIQGDLGAPGDLSGPSLELRTHGSEWAKTPPGSDSCCSCPGHRRAELPQVLGYALAGQTLP